MSLKPPKITREFHVDRGRDFIMVYPFTTYVTVFEKHTGTRDLLSRYFRSLLRYGAPDAMVKSSVSQCRKLFLDGQRVESDLVEYAVRAEYQGMGNEQHETVQRVLHAHDRYTFA